MGGGGTSIPSTTTSTQAPWSGQIPYLEGGDNYGGISEPGVFPAAAGLYNNPSDYPQYFPGSTYAPLTGPQNSLISTIEGFGNNGGSTALQAADSGISSLASPNATAGTSGAFGDTQGYLSSLINGSTLNPFQAPGFQNVVNSTLASVIPATSASFINGGRSDSGLAQAATTAAATNAVGNLANQNYLQEQQLQQGAANLASNNYLTQQGNQVRAALAAPTIDQSQLQDMTTALSAGGMTQSDQQNLINAAIQQWNYQQQLPYNMLGNYASLVNGTGYGSTGTSTQPYYSNNAANIASGIIGGTTGALGLGSGISSLLGYGSLGAMLF